MPFSIFSESMSRFAVENTTKQYMKKTSILGCTAYLGFSIYLFLVLWKLKEYEPCALPSAFIRTSLQSHCGQSTVSGLGHVADRFTFFTLNIHIATIKCQDFVKHVNCAISRVTRQQSQLHIHNIVSTD